MIDIVWIGIAFGLGLLASRVGLPPLAGYLVAGFVLHAMGIEAGDTMAEFAELGVTLLLFTIGLKLKVGTLLKNRVWGTATIHMASVTAVFGLVLIAASNSPIDLFGGFDTEDAFIVAFALSFSSTVFAVKVLEARGDIGSLYGSTAIGILIIQDIIAVAFLAATAGKVPSPWALLLLPALWPIRLLMMRILSMVGHGELLVLFGLTVAIGGAELFNLFKVKGDLGALILGILLAQHRSAEELAKALLAFKDLFLVGFFLSVGMMGLPGLPEVLLAVLLVAAIPIKSALFFALLLRFRTRARTGLMAGLGLSNYSEFGLIVLALAVSEGWLGADWLVAFAVALALSFVAASPVNRFALNIYDRFHDDLRRLERDRLSPSEAEIDPGHAAAFVFGMGRIGTGAFDKLVKLGVTPVIGIDSSLEVVTSQLRQGRMVIRASGTDADFWTRLKIDVDELRYVILSMPSVHENLFAARHIRDLGYPGTISAVTRYPDHVLKLHEAGVDHVVNLYEEAGAGLAEDAVRGEGGSRIPAETG
ncbi:MAG: cation:proton antiporter family protein [Pseudomonadota bacterium]